MTGYPGGGDGCEEAILDLALEEFRRRTGIDLSADLEALSRVRDRCHKAAQDVERCGVANVNVPFLVFDGQDPVHFDVTVTREDIAARVKR